MSQPISAPNTTAVSRIAVTRAASIISSANNAAPYDTTESAPPAIPFFRTGFNAGTNRSLRAITATTTVPIQSSMKSQTTNVRGSSAMRTPRASATLYAITPSAVMPAQKRADQLTGFPSELTLPRKKPKAITATVAMSRPSKASGDRVSFRKKKAPIATNRGARPRITGNTSDKSPRCKARIMLI